MRIPRLAVLCATALLAVAGCGQATDANGDGAPAAATTAPADPTERVNAAARKMESSSFKFSIESAGAKVEGVRHKPSESVQIKMSGTGENRGFTADVIQIGDDMWMKMDLGLDAGDNEPLQGFADALGKWNHIAKDEAESELGPLANAGSGDMGTKMVDGVSNLKETAPGTFTGTIDLTRTDVDVTDEDTVKALGDQAKAVPITITLDSEERLGSLVMDLPAAGAAKAQQATIKFFDFEKVQQPKAPPADQVNEQ